MKTTTQYIRHRVSALVGNQHKEFKHYTAAEKWAVNKFGCNFVIQSWYK